MLAGCGLWKSDVARFVVTDAEWALIQRWHPGHDRRGHHLGARRDGADEAAAQIADQLNRSGAELTKLVNAFRI